MIGTTNQTDHLRDSTGNRRFWPIACVTADDKWIELNRGQLWAEAAEREASGEQLWLGDDRVIASATEAQRDRLVEDVWEDTIQPFLQGRYSITTADILTGALMMTPERQDRRAQIRVAAILRGAGWIQKVERTGPAVSRVWRRASDGFEF
jgi:putative DNA primase/helicase